MKLSSTIVFASIVAGASAFTAPRICIHNSNAASSVVLRMSEEPVQANEEVAEPVVTKSAPVMSMALPFMERPSALGK
jgi:hypothetical protein